MPLFYTKKVTLTFALILVLRLSEERLRKIRIIQERTFCTEWKEVMEELGRRGKQALAEG